MSLIARLDDARSRRNILEHTFYTRWERGELTRAELAAYAAEYRHAVVALADAAELAGSEHAAEEREHVVLWEEFATALDADLERAPRAETRRCAAAWTSASDPLEALAILYAIEAGQPDVSRTKLDGPGRALRLRGERRRHVVLPPPRRAGPRARRGVSGAARAPRDA